MKRGRLPSSSEDSDDNGSLSTTWSQNSRSQHRRSSCSRHEDRKPSEVFRTDLITAMKLHDSYQLNPDEYYVLADPWRQEWEKGVQVPVSPGTIPQPVARVVSEEKSLMFIRPKKYIVSSGSEPPELGYVDIRTLADSVCRYDLNDMDAAWLELTNEEFKEMGMPELDEYTMERVLEEFEQRCYDNMNHAIETEEGLGIEYDEDVVCDVCQSPDGEDGNEMVFCDKCNICVHQACYGILKVPEGSWLCRTCALGVQPKCLLCPKKGGAMKPTRSGTKWVHVSCALWIPEVSIGSPEKMEPITKVSHIPSSRWALVCSLCNEKFGASIQCSVKNCRTAFHVTCAFDRGLEMKTILAENDEVKFKSYCPKHSSHRKPDESLGEGAARENGAPERPPRDPLEPFGSLEQNQEEAHRVSVRKQKLQQLEDEFYTFVNLLDVARALRLPEEVVDFLYQYWKLKRKVNFNKPLITPKKDEEDNLAKREQDVLFRRLQLFTHLRQDLERVMVDTDTLW
ncbi:protein Jade-1 isoform X3 [Phocoena phocoena]|uniref:protein Jade-1 isoform X3 n=1 Tax=Phocoena phocoena TaxID=9742 RepID=UPI003306E637